MQMGSPDVALKRLSMSSNEESVCRSEEGGNKAGSLFFSDGKQVFGDENGLTKFRCNRRTGIASHFDSSQISHILNPPRGIRDLMQRKGIIPRNHAKDNRAAIAQLSALNHARRQSNESVEGPPPLPAKHPRIEIPSSTAKDINSIDFLAKNVREVAKVARRVSKQEPEVPRKKENFGKIPAYLIKRKIELAQQAEERIEKEKAKRIPPGCVLMEDEEKEEVLKTLEENKKELEKKLSTMSLVCETPSQIRVRSDVDQQLLEIENAIKRFSRANVYISLND